MNIHRFFAISMLTVLFCQLNSRSPYRTPDLREPTITVRWSKEPGEVATFTNRYLQEYPFFKLFDKKFFYDHLFPNGSLTIRNSSATVDTAHLQNLIEGLLVEIKAKAKEYTHFDVLQCKDFSRRKGCGLLIVKFKNYPFVVKLFIETPESFTQMWGKGMVPVFLFYLGGGVNRHLAGFTRISNLETIKNRIDNDPAWSHRIDLPRKWFWLPKDTQWLEITGTNLGKKKHQFIKIPATYAIIADAIEPREDDTIAEGEDAALSLHICNMLEMSVDPHSNNVMIEKGTNKIVLIDTEHFPTIVGLDVDKHFDGYPSWIMHLMSRCAKSMFLTPKQAERKHKNPSLLA